MTCKRERGATGSQMATINLGRIESREGRRLLIQVAQWVGSRWGVGGQQTAKGCVIKS